MTSAGFRDGLGGSTLHIIRGELVLMSIAQESPYIIIIVLSLFDGH